MLIHVCDVSACFRILTLAYVKARGLRQAVHDELQGLGAGVHCPRQVLNAAAPDLLLHTLL